MMGIFVTGGAGHSADDLRFIRRLLSLGVATKASGSSLAHQHLRCGLILRLVQDFRDITRHIGHEPGAALGAFGREGSEPRCLGPARDGDMAEHRVGAGGRHYEIFSDLDWGFRRKGRQLRAFLPGEDLVDQLLAHLALMEERNCHGGTVAGPAK